ncbi:DUF952 domain-containing protein [Parvularcula dongshanensis]|uniref:Uncharacterized protein (DUF952 family) n=1 Tax=Parvularcula dongshanensis TaxID=1173995 RepID=A0A840I1R0_9PROT|nr:DUF952 domain-containing protein [Parvularcula dongshanensis]MBB4658182.1 uncharacterized protein (DUF952 family) [Parvularcula dongshanensis]
MSEFERGFVYRLTSEEGWRTAKETGTLPWNADDERDGFFHLSGPEQVQDTARRHYGEELGLLALGIPEKALKAKLKREANDSGEAFPHYYGKVQAKHVDHLLRLTRGMAGSYMVVARLEP